MLGIKKLDKKSISRKFICKLFKKANNLEICINHAIEINIKKTSIQDLNICIKMYKFNFFIMAVSIDYISNLSIKDKNIVIFVSSLSQLKNIDFITNIRSFVNDEDFFNQIKSNKYTLYSNIKINNNFLANVIISLVKPSTKNLVDLGGSLSSYFSNLNEKNATFYFSKEIISSFKDKISNLIFGYCLKSYNFIKYKKIDNGEDKTKILRLYRIKEFNELRYNFNLLNAINFTKDLVSEPANILNPVSYAEECLKLKKYGLKIKILNRSDLEKIGMRSLLGVSQGSHIDPRVVIFEWNVKKNTKPIILVGKGVTFDTGGISLKTPSGMEEMITDMGGSAVVVGSMINAALNKFSNSLVGIIGLVENMPDGKAQRPGDIVKSLSGQSIEILNTDAEGRLVLADIITYIQSKYSPKLIIDFATLTGAIMIALGTHRAGLFSNNDSLSKKIEIAGNQSGEKVWRLPLGPEYDNEINSTRADMKNIGSSRYGGSIHAAQFIERFVKKDIPWAHLDIAGVSWNMKAGLNSFSRLHAPGATAFGVRLIDKFLKGK